MRLLVLWVTFSSAAMALAGDATQDTPENRRAYEQAALTSVGNVDRGKKLFFDQARNKCSVCHRVREQGGNVGPELSQIGGKFDRPHLIESILEPSRQIVEGFRTTTILTTDGMVHSGIVKSRSASAIGLLDAANKSIVLPTSEIETERTSDVSIMPTGLASSLSQDDFVDLIAYLESLRSGAQNMGAGVRGPIQLPSGFRVSTVATGMDGAVALEVAPDGRVFVCEQPGKLRVIRDGKLLGEPFVTLPVLLEWERGLIGVTVDPNFDQTPYVYVCYVAKTPYPHHVVSRFLADGDVAKPNSEEILLEGDDQRKMGGNVPAGHQGGALHFGPDGCLYIGLGEQTSGLPSQNLDTLIGKLLRIRGNGKIPDDNPFVGKVEGKYQAIWAYGLRNPFTFAFQKSSGDLLINDVGGKVEEVNRGIAGKNYGWPVVEHGPTNDARFVGPIHTYPQASISGGDFVPDKSKWPEQYRGKYLFADFVHGWIRAIDPVTADPVSANQSVEFATGLRRPVDLRFGPDGSLYVLIRNAWVVDDKFEGGTSSLLRIDFSQP